MIVTQVEFGTPAYDELIFLRDLILREPLGLKFSPEELSEEYTSIHFAAYSYQDELLGTLVLKPLSPTCVKMRQVAVFPFAQKKGVGQQMVSASEVYAREHLFEEMELNARLPAVPFYEKLGYQIEGNKFTEVGIDHYKMRKQL